jgi:hypothetical protein
MLKKHISLHNMVNLKCALCHLAYAMLPSSLQRYINATFSGHVDKQRPQRNILNEFVICYMDDIIIFSKDADSHMQHVEEVLSILDQNNLFNRPTKCEWDKTELKNFLGFTLKPLGNRTGITPSSDNVEAVMDWPVPRSVTDVRSFLGVCNFNRRHMLNYSKIARPLYDLTKQSTMPDWQIKHQ